MRRSTVRLAGLLVAISLAGVAPALVGAQEGGIPEPGERIVYQRIDPEDPTDELGEKVELYQFTFEVHEAHLPEPEQFPDISREDMTVFVDAGLFVLYTPPDMREGAVIVVTGDDRPIMVEAWSSPDTMDSRHACDNPCSVAPDRYVEVAPGDFVYHAKGSYCPYCNEFQGASVLHVAPLTETDGAFSWREVTTEAEAEFVPNEEATPTARRMAYRLNPNPPCAGKYS